jgi:hypothetical protein
VRGNPDDLKRDWQESAGPSIVARHGMISRVQFEEESLERLLHCDRFSITAFTIKTQGVCIHGSDLAPDLPDFRPGVAVANDALVQIRADIDEAVHEIRNATVRAVRDNWCRRIMKNVVRAAFALVLVDAHAYTSDLTLCAERFAPRFPALAPDVWRAVAFASAPPGNRESVLRLLDTFGARIIAHADAWLDVHNPQRIAALPLDAPA